MALAILGAYHTSWRALLAGEPACEQPQPDLSATLNVLGELDEALLIWPDYPGLDRSHCLHRLGRRAEAAVACLMEYRRQPDMPLCREWAREIGCIDEDGRVNLAAL